MRILIIPTTDWLGHPTPHRHHYLAEFLTRRNDVYVLYFDIFKGDRTWKTRASLVKAGGCSTENLMIYYTMNAPVHFSTISGFLKKQEIDVILGAHPITNLIGIMASRKLNRRQRPTCLFDFNDFFPEGASFYYTNQTVQTMVRNGGELLLKRNLRSADVVTTVSRPMEKYAKRAGAKDVNLIANGVDTNIFKETAPDPVLKEELCLGDNVIGFVGTIERWFDLDMIMKGFARVKERNPDAQLMLVGGGIKTDYLGDLMTLARDLKVYDSVIATGIVPYYSVPEYISLMNVCVIPPLKKGLFMARIAQPNKLFQYAACGKPILSYSLGEVLRTGGDAVTPFTTTEQFADRALELLSSHAGNEAGLALAQRHSWEAQTKKFEVIMERGLRH